MCTPIWSPWLDLIVLYIEKKNLCIFEVLMQKCRISKLVLVNETRDSSIYLTIIYNDLQFSLVKLCKTLFFVISFQILNRTVSPIIGLYLGLKNYISTVIYHISDQGSIFWSENNIYSPPPPPFWKWYFPPLATCRFLTPIVAFWP